MDLPESGFAVFGILFTFWSEEYSCADILNICIYFVLLDCEQLKEYKHFVSVCRTDFRKDCWMQLANLTVNYVNGTVVRSDWFHHCMIVQTIKSI